MRILVQECLEAKVVVEGKTVGEINRGEVLFVGFTSGDDENTISFMIDKLLKLRIFPEDKLQPFSGFRECACDFSVYTLRGCETWKQTLFCLCSPFK